MNYSSLNVLHPFFRALNTYIYFFFQLVIGVQWLVSDPADVLFNQVEESVIAVLRCGIFGFCLVSFPQNERKEYKLRQLSLSQFVYFLREMCLLFNF